VSFGFYFALYYGAGALVNPGGYTQGVTLGITNALQPNGENVTLSSTAPTGLNVTFAPASPVFLSGDTAVNVTLTITAGSTVAPGNYTIGVKGVSGANSQSASFSVNVVQYRVVMTQDTFFPGVLNVTVGSTVYWQNFDGPGCGVVSTGNGQHNIVFTTLPGVNSSTINQFQIYKYTFTTAGSFFYYSSLNTDHLMNGTINVAGSSGAGGMGVTMPAFSFFKDGNALEVPPGAIAATAVAVPAGGETAPARGLGVGLGDLVFPDLHYSPSSGLGLGAAISVLLGLAALGAALAVSTTGKRELTAVGAERLSRPLPSGASY
jgi:plastocyanin